MTHDGPHGRSYVAGRRNLGQWGAAMSFRIFAVGHGGARQYNYMRANLRDEADIDTALQIQAVAEGSYGSAAGVAKTGYDVYSAGPGDTASSVMMYGKFVFSELIQTGIQYLQLSGGAANGKVVLSARETHALWPDTVRFIQVSLADDDAGYQFMKKIKGALSDTNMYTNGVLRQISDVLSLYATSLSGVDGATPWLSFQLQK